MIVETLGDKIRNLRKSKHMTQETLSGFLTVSRKAISRYENNIVLPQLETLHAIAKIFNVDVMEFINSKEYQCDINRINRVNTVEDLIDYLLATGIIQDINNISPNVENIILESAKKYMNEKKEHSFK